MKTIIKKRRFLAALTAALLISAALIASCMNQLTDGSNDKLGAGDIQVPAGKGVIRLNIGEINARTIYPSDLPDVEDMYYDIVIEKGADGLGGTVAGAGITKGDIDDAQDLIVLEAGTYKIVITAYDDALGTNTLAGWTSPDEGVKVSSSEVKDITANLIGFTDSGSGAFEYNITVPTLPSGWLLTTAPLAYSTATLEIKNNKTSLIYGNGGSHDTPITFVEAGTYTHSTVNSELASLPAGYYTVTVTLEAANCQDRIITNAMHIYNTMTSKYGVTGTPIVVPMLNQGKFTVQFDLNGHAADGTSNAYNPALEIQLLDDVSLVSDPGDPAATDTDDVTFNGWFTLETLSVAGATAWSLPKDSLFKDTTLYAKWTSNGSGVNITIEFKIEDAGITAVYYENGNTTPTTFSPTNVAYDDIKSGDVYIEFTLTGGSFSDIKWDLDGTAIPEGDDSDTLTIGKTFSKLGRLVSGTHVLNVSGKKGVQPFNSSVTIIVNNP